MVSPDIAETTTTTSCPAFWAAMQRRATFLMRSTSPTEVPPYFWTISATVAASSCERRGTRSEARRRLSKAPDGRCTRPPVDIGCAPVAVHAVRSPHMSRPRLLIDGDTLRLEEILAGRPQRVDGGARPRGRRRACSASRALVDRVAAGDAPAYGINTGFGTLAEVRIDKKDLRELQRNLILSHAAGVGTPLPLPEARALLLLRCNVLAKGFSGIRPETLQLALDMLNRGVVPVVPERGSVGASGDLAPLAHLALVLIGEGEAFSRASGCRRARRWSAPGSSRWCWRPRRAWRWSTAPRRCARWARSLQLRAETLADAGGHRRRDDAGGAAGQPQALHPGDPGRAPAPGPEGRAPRTCAGCSPAASWSRPTSNCSKVQDPYSLRCMPQVHGAARDGLAFARRILEVEVNSATDNPLVFVGRASGSSPAATSTASRSRWRWTWWPWRSPSSSSISERRVEQLVNPSLSGLPPFLAKNSGLNSGFMIAQVTARRAGRRVAHPLPPGLGGLHPLLRRPRGPRVHGHDRGAQGAARWRSSPAPASRSRCWWPPRRWTSGCR